MERENRNTLSIRVYPRLHLTLLSMTSGSYRQNGGLGFAVDGPSAKVEFFLSELVGVIDLRSSGMISEESKALTDMLEEVCKKNSFLQRATVVISGELGCHLGLGAGTAVRLAAIEGLCLLNDRTVTVRELQDMSERGGTSGVGIRTYFDGGFVLDLGKPASGERFKSSDEQRHHDAKSLMSFSSPMPQWQVGLCIPNDLEPVFGAREREFFDRTCPVDIASCALTTFHSIFGVQAAVMEGRVDDFCKAVDAIQGIGWKKAEWDEHGDRLRGIASGLRASGASCVGMTSLGPSLFFLGNVDEICGASIGQAYNSRLHSLSVRNSGRVIERG